MAVEKLDIISFLSMSAQHPVIDVRSPGEYVHAHIPGAISLPLFTDEQRKQIGTTYKQVSRKSAIKIGLEYFGPNMRSMVEAVEQLMPEADNTILVHCWRGGMRSGAVSWLLDLYGFKVYVLHGGYKAYRQWCQQQFAADRAMNILGGYTGSGKTAVLQRLKAGGQPVIDLEALAVHKGSAFGALDRLPQPTQEMFENLLATELHKFSDNNNTPIWLEDESQRIGNLNIPKPLWDTIRTQPVYFLEIPFEERLAYIVRDYGSYSQEKLINAIVRIQKRLGGLETKTAIGHLLEKDITGCFRILLQYYDKQYRKALDKRPDLSQLLHTVSCGDADAQKNAASLLANLTHGRSTNTLA